MKCTKKSFTVQIILNVMLKNSVKPQQLLQDLLQKKHLNHKDVALIMCFDQGLQHTTHGIKSVKNTCFQIIARSITMISLSY